MNTTLTLRKATKQDFPALSLKKTVYFFVETEKGKVVGLLWKHKNTKTDTFPWQVDRTLGWENCPSGIPGRKVRQSMYVGAEYPQNPSKASSNTARTAVLHLLMQSIQGSN